MKELVQQRSATAVVAHDKNGRVGDRHLRKRRRKGGREGGVSELRGKEEKETLVVVQHFVQQISATPVVAHDEDGRVGDRHLRRKGGREGGREGRREGGKEGGRRR